jgi:hypothetical protein
MDGKVYVYDDDGAGTLGNLKVLAHESMRSGVRTMARAGDCVFTGAEDGTVACWGLRDLAVRASGAVHGKIVSALCAVGDLVRTFQHLTLPCHASIERLLRAVAGRAGAQLPSLLAPSQRSQHAPAWPSAFVCTSLSYLLA